MVLLETPSIFARVEAGTQVSAFLSICTSLLFLSSFIRSPSLFNGRQKGLQFQLGVSFLSATGIFPNRGNYAIYLRKYGDVHLSCFLTPEARLLEEITGAGENRCQQEAKGPRRDLKGVAEIGAHHV